MSVVPTPSDNPEPVHIAIVCSAAGLTTAAYSFGYVAHWAAGDPQAVKATAGRVITAVRTILDRTGLLAEPTTGPETIAA